MSFIVTLYYLSSTIVQHVLPTNGHMGSVLYRVLFVTWKTWKNILIVNNKYSLLHFQSAMLPVQHAMKVVFILRLWHVMNNLSSIHNTVIFLIHCYILLNSNICHDIGNINLFFPFWFNYIQQSRRFFMQLRHYGTFYSLSSLTFLLFSHCLLNPSTILLLLYE